MDPLESTLQAAKRVADLGGAGAGDLSMLLREKYLLPRMQKIKSLSDAHGLYEAMGAVEFRTVLAQLDPKKAAALLRKLDKHAPANAPETSADYLGRITDLAAGKTKPSPPPVRATARARAVLAETLPDVRGVYRAEGIEAVAATLNGLSLAALKALVAKQNLEASIPPGKGAPGFRKYIQVAVREELGARTDVFAAIASLSDKDEGA